MADLNLAFNAYIATLIAASGTPDKDAATVVAQDLPTVRAAHQLVPEDLDDLNTLYRVHLNG